MTGLMRAWQVTEPGAADISAALRLRTVPVPTPGADELLVRGSVCGVCPTDLHGLQGDLPGQLASGRGATVHVLPGAAVAQQLARPLGAASAGDAYDAPPEPLDAAILFAPVGELVPVALAALDRGGTLSIAGIYLSDIPTLNYQRHLFQERALLSVTANTREDGRQFLDLAARHPLEVATTAYPFTEAVSALRDLAADRVNGAAVLHLP